jgi:homoserine O-acetyltransferase/O-succinyltransferase
MSKHAREKLLRGWLAGVALLSWTTLATAQQLKFANLGDLKLESGETLRDCRVGYRTFGQLNGSKNNAILFPTWFNGKSEQLVQMVGVDKMLDPDQYFVVLIDALANGVSSSPSNSAAQAKDKFPRITIPDMVNAEHRLATNVLGLSHVRVVIGISMGGMQTFQWSVSYPDFMDIAIPIVGTPQQSSFDLLVWTTEESTIEYRLKQGDEKNATDAAQRIGLIEITSPAHVIEELSRSDFETHVTKSLAEWKKDNDPYDYLAQLRAMIALDVAPQGGALEDAAKRVRAKMLVIAARQDHLVNPLAGLRFAELLKAPTLVLESDCGHMATVCQEGVMIAAVRGFLTENQNGPLP